MPGAANESIGDRDADAGGTWAKMDPKALEEGATDWKHPDDPEAQITKTKDGRTCLAHKLDQTVDMETGLWSR